MVEKSLADRVSALEAKVGSKTLEEQFREQGEMLDQRFVHIHQRLDEITTDVGILKTDVGFLKKEVAIIREGISMLLNRRRASRK